VLEGKAANTFQTGIKKSLAFCKQQAQAPKTTSTKPKLTG
jgi:hypothetical protein